MVTTKEYVAEATTWIPNSELSTENTGPGLLWLQLYATVTWTTCPAAAEQPRVASQAPASVLASDDHQPQRLRLDVESDPSLLVQ